MQIILLFLPYYTIHFLCKHSNPKIGKIATRGLTTQQRKACLCVLRAFVSTASLILHSSKQGKSWSDPCLGPICSRRLLLSSSAHNSNGPYVFPHVGIKRVCARPIIRYTRKTTSWGPGVFMRGAVQTCWRWTQGLAAARPRLALPFFAPQLLYYAALYIRFDHKLCRLRL